MRNASGMGLTLDSSIAAQFLELKGKYCEGVYYPIHALWENSRHLIATLCFSESYVKVWSFTSMYHIIWFIIDLHTRMKIKINSTHNSLNYGCIQTRTNPLIGLKGWERGGKMSNILGQFQNELLIFYFKELC